MELQRVEEVRKRFAESKLAAKLDAQKCKAARSVEYPYNYLNNLKGKKLRSKLMEVSEFLFEVLVLGSSKF